MFTPLHCCIISLAQHPFTIVLTEGSDTAGNLVRLLSEIRRNQLEVKRKEEIRNKVALLFLLRIAPITIVMYKAGPVNYKPGTTLSRGKACLRYICIVCAYA